MTRFYIILISLFCLIFFVVFFAHKPIKPFYNIPISGSKQSNEIAKNINDKQQKITSIMAEITAKTNRPIRVTGFLAYKKPRCFRMQLNSFLGLEVDLGSNNQYFWFYSKRMKPSYWYYASYQNVNNTRLKPMFHPLWLMDSLGINSIPLDAQFIRKGDFVYGSELKWHGNSTLYKTFLIDNKPTVVGHYLFDSDKMLASSETESFAQYGDIWLPRTIRYVWYEEGEVLTLHLQNIKVNVEPPSDLWVLPKKNMVDISK